MKTQTKHTAKIRYEEGTKTLRSVPENYWIATMDSWDGAVDNKANAEFIVRACNSHEALVEACKAVVESGLLSDLNGDETGGHLLAELRNALNLAEGK